MANLKQEFGTSTSITITLNSLAASATEGRESTAIDNTSDKFLDALVNVTVKFVAGTPSSATAVFVYVYGSEDGTNYTDNATGTDAAITFRNPTAMVLLGTIPIPTSGALTYKSHPMAVAKAFGGVMPRKWGIAVMVDTGVNLDSTGNSAKYTGIYATST